MKEAVALDPLNKRARYNLACALARLGKTSDALAELRALDADYRRMARSDEDFKTLHGTSEFEALFSDTPATPAGSDSDSKNP